MVRHLTGLFAVTMGAGLVGGLWLAAASPADDDVGSGTALARHVSIRRDTFGIPHILAETEEAAAFGFGYAQAEDHAVEIARLFIRARGQEARYFGRSGIENDVAMRRFDNYEEAKKGLNQVSALYRPCRPTTLQTSTTCSRCRSIPPCPTTTCSRGSRGPCHDAR